MEDAEINYYGLNDHLIKGDSYYNNVFKKYYETYYENANHDNDPKEFSIFDEITLLFRKIV